VIAVSEDSREVRRVLAPAGSHLRSHSRAKQWGLKGEGSGVGLGLYCCGEGLLVEGWRDDGNGALKHEGFISVLV
jgi:hypothetical protein